MSGNSLMHFQQVSIFGTLEDIFFFIEKGRLESPKNQPKPLFCTNLFYA
jgi:hypothetical protein